MRTVTRILSTTVAVAALAGLVGAGAAQAAETGSSTTTLVTGRADDRTAPEGGMRIESTRRFTITNLGDRTLRVRSVATTWDNDPTPAAGTVVRPGDDLPVEVTWWFGWDQDVTVTFDLLDGAGRAAGRADVTMRLGSTAQPSSFGTAGGGLMIKGNGQDVRIVTDHPTEQVVPATRRAEQSDIVNRLVATGKAQATFVPTAATDTAAWTAPFISGEEIITNTSSSDATQTISSSVAQGESTSLEVSASVKVAFGSLVEASLTTSFGKEWSTTRTFTSSVTVTAKPGEAAWVEVRNPVRRATGDLRVTAGATTWVLQGVTFDTPDASRKALANPRSRMLTPQEISDLGPGLHLLSPDRIAP